VLRIERVENGVVYIHHMMVLHAMQRLRTQFPCGAALVVLDKSRRADKTSALCLPCLEKL
jgi:hypothetical protein